MTQKVFRTSDGYTFYRIQKGASFVWVDNLDPDRVDMTFDDVNGEPVDIFEENLEGDHKCGQQKTTEEPKEVSKTNTEAK
jgi:hypothetical protein